MCKDKNMFALILGIMMIVLFITVDVFAQDAAAGAVQYAEDTLKAGLGKYESADVTMWGNFKECSTDAYFYLIAVNETDKDVDFVLPTRVAVGSRWFYVDRTAYKYAYIGSNNGDVWSPDSYEAAQKGDPLNLGVNYTMKVPAGYAYSVMGRIKDISHEYFTETADENGVTVKAVVTVNGNAINAKGAFTSEGSVCTSITELPLSGENYIYGFYRVSETPTDVCSMAFYFMVENIDDKYSTTVELPRWVEINGDRWTIGCDPIANDCLVSGFRHYAYTEMNEDGTFKDSEFTFCDQDYALGDNCYQENGLWWLEVPAGKSIVIRSMVNDFCSPQNDLTNPLMNSYINMAVQLGDSGTNLRMIGGDVIGTAVSGLGSAKVITFLGDDPDSMISSEANADPVRVAEPVAEDEFTADVAKTVDLPDANTADPDPIQFFVLN